MTISEALAEIESRDNPDDWSIVVYPEGKAFIVPALKSINQLGSIHDQPSEWSVSVGIHSHEWITATWYRWHYSGDDGLMISTVYEWCLRQFWKIDKTP